MKKKRLVGLGLTLALLLSIIGTSAQALRPGTPSCPSFSAAGVQRDEAAQGITVLNLDADSGAPLEG